MNFTVRPGENKGAMLLSCDPVENANYYEFEFTDAPSNAASIWVQKTSTKHKMLIDGFISEKQYTYRVAAAGSDPSRTWSDEVTSFVI